MAFGQNIIASVAVKRKVQEALSEENGEQVPYFLVISFWLKGQQLPHEGVEALNGRRPMSRRLRRTDRRRWTEWRIQSPFHACLWLYIRGYSPTDRPTAMDHLVKRPSNPSHTIPCIVSHCAAALRLHTVTDKSMLFIVFNALGRDDDVVEKRPTTNIMLCRHTTTKPAAQNTSVSQYEYTKQYISHHQCVRSQLYSPCMVSRLARSFASRDKLGGTPEHAVARAYRFHYTITRRLPHEQTLSVFVVRRPVGRQARIREVKAEAGTGRDIQKDKGRIG
ncbi:hypothetical protein CBL_09173 [Carabus blaptoides fortunei]